MRMAASSPAQALTFIAETLAGELRRFDRLGRPGEEELVVVLPGADGPLAEMVARRVLSRLRSIKVESDGVRRALRIRVGLATWTKDVSAFELLEEARAAVGGEHLGTGTPSPTEPPVGLRRDVPS